MTNLALWISAGRLVPACHMPGAAVVSYVDDKPRERAPRKPANNRAVLQALEAGADQRLQPVHGDRGEVGFVLVPVVRGCRRPRSKRPRSAGPPVDAPWLG